MKNNRKSGKNDSGTQRYYCNVCGHKFTIGSIIGTFIDKLCPYCKGHNLKRAGQLRSGAKRYFCKDCNKHFSDVTIVDEKKTPCTHCSSTAVVKCGLSSHGHQRWKCKTCGTRFTEEPMVKAPQLWEKTCPKCGHKYATKAGMTGDRKQYWKCKECNHKFLLDGKYRQTDEMEREYVVKLLEEGKTKAEISEMTGISYKTIYHITKGMEIPWLKQRAEEVARRKEDNIKRVRNNKRNRTRKRNQKLREKQARQEERLILQRQRAKIKAEQDKIKQAKQEKREISRGIITCARLKRKQIALNKIRRNIRKRIDMIVEETMSLQDKINYTNEKIALVAEDCNSLQYAQLQAKAFAYISGKITKHDFYSFARSFGKEARQERTQLKKIDRQYNTQLADAQFVQRVASKERHERIQYAQSMISEILDAQIPRYTSQAQTAAVKYTVQEYSKDCFDEIIEDIKKKVASQIKKQQRKARQQEEERRKEIKASLKPAVEVVEEETTIETVQQEQVELEEQNHILEIKIEQDKAEKERLEKEQAELRMWEAQERRRIQLEIRRKEELKQKERLALISKTIDPLIEKCLMYDGLDLDECLVELQTIKQRFLDGENVLNFEDIQAKIDTAISNREAIEAKKKLEKSILKGRNLHKLSEECGLEYTEVLKLAKKLVKKEVITPQQKQDIVKYGVMLNVPVDYMAEYIPCSEFMCEQVIAEYREKQAQGLLQIQVQKKKATDETMKIRKDENTSEIRRGRKRKQV